MMAGITLMQRGGSELVAAVIAQNALLLRRGQPRVGDGDVEPAGPVATIGAGAVVGGVWNDRPHERRCGITPNGAFGIGASLRSATKSRARAISLEYASTSSLGP